MSPIICGNQLLGSAVLTCTLQVLCGNIVSLCLTVQRKRLTILWEIKKVFCLKVPNKPAMFRIYICFTFLFMLTSTVSGVFFRMFLQPVLNTCCLAPGSMCNIYLLCSIITSSRLHIHCKFAAYLRTSLRWSLQDPVFLLSNTVTKLTWHHWAEREF